MASVASPVRALPRTREPRLPLELRLAWRDVRAHRGRSLLIATLIMLPVLFLTASLSTMESTQPNAAEQARLMLGRADAMLIQQPQTNGSAVCHQSRLLPSNCVAGGPRAQIPAEQVTGVVDPLTYAQRLGATSTVNLLSFQGRIAGTDRSGRPLGMRGNVIAGPAFDPLLAGRYILTNGRAPAAGEAVIDSQLAAGWRLSLGDHLRVEGTDYAVSGVVTATLSDIDVPDVILPSSPPAAPAGAQQLVFEQGARVLWPAVEEANRHAVGIYARAVALDPASQTRTYTPESRLLAVVVLGTVLAVALVVLVCGAAFSVGIKEQRRQLGLLAATGASADSLRRTVRWQAVILGLAGATLGVLSGLAALGLVALGARLVSWPFRRLLPGYNIPWLFVGLAACLGILAALVAAAVPALEVSRLDAIDAVRRAEAPSRAPRRPWAGFVLLLLGAVCAIATIVLGVLLKVEEGTGDSGQWLAVPMCIGVLSGLIGSLVCLPWILARLAAARVPVLASRLALRDLARHRGRSVPSLGAVVVTSALAFALIATFTVITTTVDANHRLAVPTDRVLVVQPGTGLDRAAVTQAVTTAIAPTRSATVRTLAVGRGMPHVCRGSACTALGRTEFDRMAGGPDDLSWFLMREPTPDERAAVRDGVVLVTSPDMLEDDGTVVVYPGNAAHGSGASASASGASAAPEPLRLPARYAPIDGRYFQENLFVPQAVADAHHLQPVSEAVAFEFDHRLTPPDLALLSGAVAALPQRTLLVQSASDAPWQQYLTLQVAAAAGLLILLIASVTVALAMADGRRDEATLAAVGGGPFLRRNLAAWQMIVTTVFGEVSGALVGLIPVYAFFFGVRHLFVVAVPWRTYAALLLGVPLVGAAAAWCLTNRRLDMRQRTM